MRRRGGEGRPERRGLIGALGDYREAWLAIAAVNVLSLVAGAMEAAALLMIVPLSEAVSADAQRLTGRIGGLTGERSPSTVIALGIVLVAGSVLLRVMASFLQVRMTRRVEARAQLRVLDAYVHADALVQQSSRSGRLFELVTWVTGHAQRLAQLSQALRHLGGVTVLLAGAILVQPGAAAAIIMAGGLLFMAFQPVIRMARRASAEATVARVPNSEHVAEVEQARTEIRAFGAEDWAHDRFVDTTARLMNARARQGVVSGMVTPLYQGVALIGIFAVLGIARSSTTLDLPALGAVAIMMLRSLAYGQGFQQSYQSVAENTEVTDRVTEAVEELEAARVTLGARKLTSVDALELRDVVFAYGDGGDVLSGVTCTLRPGDRVGLVGPSGAGKSTLAMVLLRLVSPAKGTYLVNGTDSMEFDQASWSAHIAYVPQMPRLLHATVHDNIAMFRGGITREDVERAARRAALDEAIRSLPGGYDTVVGPSTLALSGGQVQRLGLARAFAATPSVVVLDEPTSALDLQTERIVQETLDSLPADVILVVIAHRMSTLSVCNRILVLDRGNLVADDRPDQVALRSEFFEETA